MKKIGIVGGIAWPSTVDYYRGLCRRAEDRHRASGRPGPPSCPEIAVESLDVAKAAALLGDDADPASWTAFDAYHRAALARLADAGAGLAVIAAHTPHHRFREITGGARVPVVDLFDVAAREAERAGARRVLIAGTRVTMDSAVLRAAFGRRGIDADAPGDAGIRRSVAEAIADLQNGRVRGVAARIAAIVRRARRTPAPDLVCLACTELPLAFPSRGTAAVFERCGLRWLDPSAAHVAAAFALSAGDP